VDTQKEQSELALALLEAVEAQPYPRNEYGSSTAYCGECGCDAPDHDATCPYQIVIERAREYREALQSPDL
jgi:hypothetical protein